MSETPGQAEATADTVSFDYFGRTWTVPSKVRLSHQRQLNRPTAYPNVAIVNTFLDEKQNALLDEVDPDDVELDKFTDAMVKAMGLGGRGNS